MIGDLRRLHALVDRILMRTRKGRVDQFADVRVAFADRHLVGIFEDFLHALDVGAIKLGIDALREHVQRHGDDIDIAGALAIAEQRAFDAVGTGHQSQFGSSDTCAAVIVRMQ